MRGVCLLLVTVMAVVLQALPARAVTVENLQRAQVEVADHSQRELAKGTRAGFAQVLVKVSGGRSVLDNPQIRVALGQAQRYMQRYRYLRTDDDALLLQVHFDPELVNNLLREAQAPLWTANRPPVLVWLIVEDSGGRHVANDDSNPDLLVALKRQLERRGVPAVFPLYDLEDTLALDVHQLWQLDELAIVRASQRYALANILVGRMTTLPGGRWMGDWLYLSGDDSVESSFYGAELPVVSVDAVDFVADRMAARYAVAAADQRAAEILIRVDALSDYRDYRKVLAYFENIELIDAAWPAYLEGESVVFRLSAQADAEQLQRIIALNRRLQRVDEPQPLARGPINLALVYQWTP